MAGCIWENLSQFPDTEEYGMYLVTAPDGTRRAVEVTRMSPWAFCWRLIGRRPEAWSERCPSKLAAMARAERALFGQQAPGDEPAAAQAEAAR